MTRQEIIEDFFAYSFDSPEAPESTERYWEKALLDDKDYVIPYDNVCAYIRRLLKIPYSEFLIYVRQNLSKEPIESKNITQCSSFAACERDLCKMFLAQNNPGLSYEDIGKLLKNRIGSDREDALKKYGENQVKTAKQIGLAFEYYGDWYLSIIGYAYLSLTIEEQHSLLARTLLRDMLYAKILTDLSVSDVDLFSYMDCIPAESTKARRYGCVEFLVNICIEECQREGISICNIKDRGDFQKKNDESVESVSADSSSLDRYLTAKNNLEKLTLWGKTTPIPMDEWTINGVSKWLKAYEKCMTLCQCLDVDYADGEIDEELYFELTDYISQIEEFTRLLPKDVVREYQNSLLRNSLSNTWHRDKISINEAEYWNFPINIYRQYIGGLHDIVDLTSVMHLVVPEKRYYTRGDLYLERLTRIPELLYDEEMEYFDAYQQGNISARDAIIEATLPSI